jgi:DNA-binding beta-propeller fold protein YncE
MGARWVGTLAVMALSFGSLAPPSVARGTGGLQVVARIPIGISSGDVVSGFGSIWAASTFGGTVTRIDPATNEIMATIRVGRQTAAFASNGAGSSYLGVSDDSVWVSLWGPDVVKRIDPLTNEVVARIEVDSYPHQAVFAGGFVWVPSECGNGGSGSLSKIDPAMNTVVEVFPVGDPRGNCNTTYAGPEAMVEADGDLWMSVHNLDALVRFDVQTEAVVDVIHLFGRACGDLGAAEDSVWTTGGACFPPRYPWAARVDSATGAILDAWEINHASDAAEAFGMMWISTTGGRIVQIDPATDQRVGRTDAGLPIVRLAEGAGALWAAGAEALDGSSPAYVLRLEPA